MTKQEKSKLTKYLARILDSHKNVEIEEKVSIEILLTKKELDWIFHLVINKGDEYD